MSLGLIDWVIIVAFFVFTLGIGLAFRDRAGSSLTEYFLSGRSLSWWIAGTSMVATTFAADTPLAVTGLVAKNGIAGNWFWWAFALGGMFTVFVYSHLWRRAEVVTDAEFLELRYSGKPAAWLRGLRGAYMALVVNPIIIGWVTVAMLKVLKVSLVEQSADGKASIDDAWLVIGSLVIVGIYATLAGMWGVAITDFAQFFIAMLGCIWLAIVAVNHVGGVAELERKVVENFPGGEQAFRFLPDWSSPDPWLSLQAFLVMLLVQWWATWYPGAEPGGGGYVVQRMAACRNERHAVGATLWFQLAHYCVRPWPWLLVALCALAMYPDLRSLPDPGEGYPMVMRDLAGNGLAGVMVVAFFSAFMSTISTQINWGASYLVRDVYQRFLAPQASDRQLTTAARLASLLTLLIGGLAAWQMRSISVDQAWKYLAALGAGTGAVFMLRWFWWRINAWTEIVAMVASLVYFALYPRLVDQLIEGESPWKSSEEMRMLGVALATIVTWVVATLLTPPDDREHLVAFYRKVRPAGPGWKPIAKLVPEVRAEHQLIPQILAALFASGIVYCALPGIGAVIFGRYGEAAGFGAGALVCGLCVAGLMLHMERRAT